VAGRKSHPVGTRALGVRELLSQGSGSPGRVQIQRGKNLNPKRLGRGLCLRGGDKNTVDEVPTSRRGGGSHISGGPLGGGKGKNHERGGVNVGVRAIVVPSKRHCDTPDAARLGWFLQGLRGKPQNKLFEQLKREDCGEPTPSVAGSLLFGAWYWGHIGGRVKTLIPLSVVDAGSIGEPLARPDEVS